MFDYFITLFKISCLNFQLLARKNKFESASASLSAEFLVHSGITQSWLYEVIEDCHIFSCTLYLSLYSMCFSFHLKSSAEVCSFGRLSDCSFLKRFSSSVISQGGFPYPYYAFSDFSVFVWSGVCFYYYGIYHFGLLKHLRLGMIHITYNSWKCAARLGLVYLQFYIHYHSQFQNIFIILKGNLYLFTSTS